MIIGDRGKARLGGRLAAVAAQHRGCGIDMVEQRRQPVLEQWQPMVHPGLPPALAHRLIQRIAGRLRPEQVAIGRAEAFDRVLIEQGLGRGQQLQRLGGAEAALIGGIEAADAFDLVAEKVDTQARLFAGGEQVDNAAAHRKFALVGDGVDAAEPVGDEQFGERIAVDVLPRRQRRRQLADAKRGEGALGDRRNGGQDQFAAFRGLLQRRQRRQPVGADPHRRTGAVIGQAIPCRKAVDYEVGGKEGRGIGDRLHRAIVGGDIDEPPVAGARQIGEQQRQETIGGARQRQRRRCRSDRGEDTGGGHRHGSGI